LADFAEDKKEVYYNHHNRFHNSYILNLYHLYNFFHNPDLFTFGLEYDFLLKNHSHNYFYNFVDSLVGRIHVDIDIVMLRQLFFDFA